jgi:hypothetical protein
MAQQVTTGAAPLASSNGSGASSGAGTPNTTLVIGAPATAAASQ